MCFKINNKIKNIMLNFMLDITNKAKLFMNRFGLLHQKANKTKLK